MKVTAVILSLFFVLQVQAYEINFSDLPECKDNKHKPLPEVLLGTYYFKKHAAGEKNFLVGRTGMEDLSFSNRDLSYYSDKKYCVLHKWKETRKKIVLKTILKRNKFFFPSMMRFHTTHELTFYKKTKRSFYRKKELFAANVLVIVPVVVPRKTKPVEVFKN